MIGGDDFDRIAGAEMGGSRSLRIPEGTHKMEMVRCVAQPSKLNQKVTNYVFEMKVLDTTNPALPKGALCAYIQKDVWKGYESRVKAVLAAVCGTSSLTKDMIAGAFSESNPTMGELITVVGTKNASKTDKEGNPITDLSFFTCDAPRAA